MGFELIKRNIWDRVDINTFDCIKENDDMLYRIVIAVTFNHRKMICLTMMRNIVMDKTYCLNVMDKL